MKVLMLGWEFPPHISGGLGTACAGLTKGLSAHGVDVVFCMPKAHGDEEADWMTLEGANHVRYSEQVEELHTEVTESYERVHNVHEASSQDGADLVGGDPDAQVTPSAHAASEVRSVVGALRRIEIDSPLGAYQTAGTYGDELSPGEGDVAGAPANRLGDSAARPGEDVFSSFQATDWLELALRISEAVRHGHRIDEVQYEFTGAYGPGLFEEVARFAMAVCEIAKRNDVDLIHAHDWMTYPAGVAAAQLLGVPLVCHLHASEYDRTGDQPDGRVLALEKMGIESCDRLICVSHYTARVAMTRYGADAKRIRVVHNAVTQKEQRSEWHQEIPLDGKGPLVLFLGRITFQKGPDYFVEAASKVIKLRPDVRFVISGSGDMLQDIILRSARQGLMNNMFFTGFLRGADVERMYSMADLYVMPSVSEPFGITPLEAMALDVPVVVSRQSGVSEVLVNALKVDFWDTDELANQILAAISYPALRSQLVDNGRDEVRRMRWELRGELLRDHYAELVR